MSAQKKPLPSMQVFTYLVKVIAGAGPSGPSRDQAPSGHSRDQAECTRVWNTKRPMVVGHPMRWEMTQTADGVKVAALWTKTEHFLKNADIAKGKASLKLVGGTAKDSGSITVEIRPVAKLAAAFRQEPTVGSSLKIFHCIGDWAVESVALAGKYVGKVSGKKVFKLKGNAEGVYRPDALIEIKSFSDDLVVAGGKTELKLAKGDTRQVKFSDISGVTLRLDARVAAATGRSEWKLASFAKDSDPSYLTAPLLADPEAGLFKRTLLAAAAASLLLGLISFLVPSPPPVAKVETIKIMLKKKKVVAGHMTAAPTGDPSARDFSIGKSGSKKNAGKKGALARSKKVAPAGKPRTKVAEHHAAPKKAAKSVAKAARKKSAPKAVAKAARKSRSTSVAHAANSRGRKKVATVASRPAPIPHSALFKAFSTGSIQRTAKGLSGGAVAAANYSSGEASRYGSAGGTGRGDLGGAGGVDTRSASVSGFGGGGNSAGEGGPGSSGAGYGRGSNSKVSGRGRSFVSMDTGASDVEEGLTSDQVARVINSHMNEVRYCYESATLRNDSIGGRLTTKFAVGASGSVQTAGVGSSTVGDRRLHDCIVAHLKGWKFPKPRGGKTVAVQFPFDFKTLTR